MELAGRVRTIKETGETLEIVFHCCNEEVFDLIVSPAMRPPVDTILRVWTQQAIKKDSPSEVVEVIIRWEDLS